MSDIDTFDHSYIGSLAKLPVYHPLQDSEMDYFEVGANNLVIGGGSGEHPAMKVHNLDACVLSFLESASFLLTDPKLEASMEAKLAELNDILPEWNIYENLEMGRWPMDSIAKYCKKIDESFSVYQNFRMKLKKETTPAYVAVEEEIQVMLGEFLYFSGKRLLSENVQKFIKDNKELLDKTIFPVYLAVQTPSKGYPTSGRYFKDKTGVNPAWGFSFEQEEALFAETLNSSQRKPKAKKISKRSS